MNDSPGRDEELTRLRAEVDALRLRVAELNQKLAEEAMRADARETELRDSRKAWTEQREIWVAANTKLDRELRGRTVELEAMTEDRNGAWAETAALKEQRKEWEALTDQQRELVLGRLHLPRRSWAGYKQWAAAALKALGG